MRQQRTSQNGTCDGTDSQRNSISLQNTSRMSGAGRINQWGCRHGRLGIRQPQHLEGTGVERDLLPTWAVVVRLTTHICYTGSWVNMCGQAVEAATSSQNWGLHNERDTYRHARNARLFANTPCNALGFAFSLENLIVLITFHLVRGPWHQSTKCVFETSEECNHQQPHGRTGWIRVVLKSVELKAE